MEHITLLSAEKFLGFVVLGFVTGLYGTLIGAGGGFVLMPILLLLFPKENPALITSISLAVVFFNALAGSESYALMKRIDYKSGLMFAAATIPGAIIGALNTAAVSRPLFNGIFGTLLAIGGAFLAFRPDPKDCVRGTHRHYYESCRHLVEANGACHDYSFNAFVGIGLSFVVGYVSSFLGIGGGIIHVPAMTYFLHFPVHIATATSHFVLAIMSLTGTLTHVVAGTFPQGSNITLSLAIGALLGAPLGAHLSNRIQGRWIIRSLAFALCLVSIRIIMTAF